LFPVLFCLSWSENYILLYQTDDMDNNAQNQPNPQDGQQANYNPTARNFDQEGVSGTPTPINNTNSDPADRDEDLDPEFGGEQTERGSAQ
jgi:hypothetical protein